jgi:protein phosphatase 1 regulatory subunit 7
MQHRITDPIQIESDVIAAQHAAGHDVIVQFSKPGYTERELRQLNELCQHYKTRFHVRFYGHYQGSFDCLNLRDLPAVRSLAVDCLQAADNHRIIADLQNLEELSLGVYLFDDPAFLGTDSFLNLKVFGISETKKRTLDLSHIAKYRQLHTLTISGHDKGIEAVSHAAALTNLQLAQIRNTVSLDFINKIAKLTSLRLLLGGRRNIDEIEHRGLISLSVIRVRGFESFAPQKLPSLQHLHIEDQIQMKELHFSTANSPLSRVLILNCKQLDQVTGLEYLSGLNEIRISRTAINIDDLFASALPPKLKVFEFYTGKAATNTQIRARLDSLGYAESGQVG